MPCIGIEVVRHEVASTIGQRPVAAGRLSVVRAGADFHHRHRTAGTEDTHRPATTAQHLARRLGEQRFLGAKIQRTEIHTAAAAGTVDLTAGSQGQGGIDLPGYARRLGLRTQREADAGEEQSRNVRLHESLLACYQSRVTIRVSR
ncbi:hypothetical protein D3C79_836210 [compost metagenome]